MTGREMLQFDWEEVEGEAISSVVGHFENSPEGAGVRLWSIAFVLTSGAVILSVDNDSDEITVRREPSVAGGGQPWLEVEALSGLIGRKLGWCWIGRSYRGYLDTFTLALDGVDPSFMFVAEASALQCHATPRIDALR